MRCEALTVCTIVVNTSTCLQEARQLFLSPEVADIDELEVSVHHFRKYKLHILYIVCPGYTYITK